MKKTVITSLLFLASFNFTYAQFFNIGPKAGVSISQVKIKKNSDSFSASNSQLGYHGGAFVRLTLLKWYLQPEALITACGDKFERKLQSQQEEIKLRFTKLDLPVMVGYTIVRLLRVQVGPVASVLLTAQERRKGEKISVKPDYQSFTMGYQAGLGIDIWKLIIDLKYEGNLTKFGKSIAGISTDHRNDQYVLNIGIKLL